VCVTQLFVKSVAAISLVDWGKSAIEVPKARRGDRYGMGCLLPNGRGVSGSPENFLIFELKKASFGAFWVILLQLN